MSLKTITFKLLNKHVFQVFFTRFSGNIYGRLGPHDDYELCIMSKCSHSIPKPVLIARYFLKGDNSYT